VKRTHAAAAAALVILSVPALTGCFNGQKATTTYQATQNSGNGVSAQTGAIKVENATIVIGPPGSKTGTILVRIINTGPTADKLVFASVEGIPASITNSGTDLPPGASISFGWDSEHYINTYNLDAAVSTYVPVQLGFSDAGLVDMSLLTVPPVGIYEGIAPSPSTAPAASAVPSASPSPSGG
jgi:hypothetical protein